MRTSLIDGSSVPHHQTVRSVVKATQLLLCIADSEGLTAVQAAGAVGIPMGTAYHLLNTLLDEGMLSRDAARRYQLGPKIAALSIAFAGRGPSERLLLAVRRLAETTGETAYLSGWQDGQVVAQAAIEGSSAVRVGRIHTELRGHEHARASGKVMLAHLDLEALDAYVATHTLDPLTTQTIDDEQRLRTELDAVRECGYAFDEAEFTPGVGCVSAPIIESRICVGCFTISAPLERFEQNRRELTEAVVRAAREVSHP
jgi:IclR family acetate operon transcriptional repressor